MREEKILAYCGRSVKIIDPRRGDERVENIDPCLIVGEVPPVGAVLYAELLNVVVRVGPTLGNDGRDVHDAAQVEHDVLAEVRLLSAPGGA
jgi:hypothetical protein